MTRNRTFIALLLSLALNIAVVAGYLYQYHQHRVAASGHSLDAVAATLGLNASERASLQALRQTVFAQVRDLRRQSATANADLRRLVASAGVDDPQLAAALTRIAGERATLQRDAISALIHFRDNLSPQARERFAAAIQEKGFLLAMFGVSSWGLPQDTTEPR